MPVLWVMATLLMNSMKRLREVTDLNKVMLSATHTMKTKGIDASLLSKMWRIDLKMAERTLDVTSQSNKRVDNPTLSHNYGTNDRMLRYKQISEYFFMDTFFATKKAGKSTRNNTCCQLFVTDKGFVYVAPLKSKANMLDAVKQFAKEIGGPDALIFDMSREHTSQSLLKFFLEIRSSLCVLEEGKLWANKAELYSALIKEAVRKDMKESNCPLVLWDYCVKQQAHISNDTPTMGICKLHSLNAHTALTGDEGNISNLCQYQKEKFPFNREILGRVLGPAKGEGNKMAQWILKAKGRVVPCYMCRPLTVMERHSAKEQKKHTIFYGLIMRGDGERPSTHQLPMMRRTSTMNMRNRKTMMKSQGWYPTLKTLLTQMDGS
jgi:hypothetical protein